MPRLSLSSSLLSVLLTAAGCGDAVSPGGAEPDAGSVDAGDDDAGDDDDDLAPCAGAPIALPGQALALAEVPVPVGTRGCRAAFTNELGLSVAVAVSDDVRLRLDERPLAPSPARATLEAGRHELALDWPTDQVAPEAFRVDVRPAPWFDGATDCDGTLVLHGDLVEDVPVTLLVPGEGVCEMTIQAETPLASLVVQAAARIHVDVALDGEPVSQGAPLSVEAGPHALRLTVADELGEEIVPLTVSVGGEMR